MEIPDIPDNRPHKSASVLSFAQSEPDSLSGHFSQHLSTPPNEPQNLKDLDAHSELRIGGDR